MKRFLSIILCAVLMVALLPQGVAHAATADSKAGAVTTAEGPLNVRSSPSSGASILTTLKKGSYITLLDQSGAWWKVEYANGRYGYCHGDYITVVQGTPAAVSTQSGPLNVRSGAGTSYARLSSLPKGQMVLLLSSNNGWSRILYHGVKTGYVSSQYLSTGGNSGSTISLQLPNFKQTDSRWGNVKIGSSGKTMAQIGCATTAIAMMESYRTGKTIYPDAMAQSLRYTASGSVYWPSHYTPVTSQTSYLSKILDLLKQDKPVLFGAKNSSGKQHWVVITGFTGGDVTASHFIIHDPGSNSRTTLQQFLNAYPSFYKYFHY